MDNTFHVSNKILLCFKVLKICIGYSKVIENRDETKIFQFICQLEMYEALMFRIRC